MPQTGKKYPIIFQPYHLYVAVATNIDAITVNAITSVVEGMRQILVILNAQKVCLNETVMNSVFCSDHLTRTNSHDMYPYL